MNDLWASDGDEDVAMWLPPLDDCMEFGADPACEHCGSRVRHYRTRRCGTCGRRLQQPE